MELADMTLPAENLFLSKMAAKIEIGHSSDLTSCLCLGS